MYERASERTTETLQLSQCTPEVRSMSGEVHEKLRLAAVSWLKRGYNWKRNELSGASCSIVLSEMTSMAGEIPDAIGWVYGKSHLVECKASRSDFFADAAKPHRSAGGAGEHRWYLAPEGMLKVEEIPEGWGLLEARGRTVVRIKDAPFINLCHGGQTHEKLMLLSALRRITMREFLIVSREEVEAALDVEVQA